MLFNTNYCEFINDVCGMCHLRTYLYTECLENELQFKHKINKLYMNGRYDMWWIFLKLNVFADFCRKYANKADFGKIKFLNWLLCNHWLLLSPFKIVSDSPRSPSKMATITTNRNLFKWSRLLHIKLECADMSCLIHFKFFCEICNFDDFFPNMQISPILMKIYLIIFSETTCLFKQCLH
jgi:hypothetical protein